MLKGYEQSVKTIDTRVNGTQSCESGHYSVQRMPREEVQSPCRFIPNGCSLNGCRVEEAIANVHILLLRDGALVIGEGSRLLSDFEHAQILAAGNDEVADDLYVWHFEGGMRFWQRVDGRRGEMGEVEGVMDRRRRQQRRVVRVHRARLHEPAFCCRTGGRGLIGVLKL